MKLFQAIALVGWELTCAVALQAQTSQAQGDKTIPVVEVEAPNVQHLWNRAIGTKSTPAKRCKGKSSMPRLTFSNRPMRP